VAKPRKRKSETSPPAETFAFNPATQRLLLIVGLGALAVLWALIYLPNLRTSPGWYGDEFITLIPGHSILNGTYANRALRCSFFSGFNNYQAPACFLFASASQLISGGDIYGARLFSALIGLATSLTAFYVLLGRGLVLEAITSCLIILCAPQSVIHFRWIYPHFFVMYGAVLAGLMLDQPRTPKRDWIIGLGCACGALGHLLFIHVTLAALIVRWRHPGAWLRIALPPLVVLLADIGFGYLISGHQVFADMSEVAFQYTQHNNGNSWLLKLTTFWTFFTWDWLDIAYVFGLIVLALWRRWALVCFTFILSAAIIQNRPELPVFYYQAMVFIPLYAICLGCALCTLVDRLIKLVPELASVPYFRYVLVAIVPAILVVNAIEMSFSSKIISRCDALVAPSSHDLETSAAWVNQHTAKDDFVVAFWDLGWMLNCRWTDMMQCAAWQYGESPPFYQRHRDRSEFLFPADLKTARYVVVGPLDLRWGYGQGGVPQLIQEDGLTSWPVVARTATTFILENPSLARK